MTKQKATKKKDEKRKLPKDAGGGEKDAVRPSRKKMTAESAAKRSAPTGTAFAASGPAAVDNTAESTNVEAPISPTPNECIIWRNGSFRKRVLLAVAKWSLEKPENISPSDTLGSLAKGVPWEEGPGQQADLVQRTNDPQIAVFAPFTGTRMAAPSEQLPASTTVVQWERKVWQQQTPRTPCFFKVP